MNEKLVLKRSALIFLIGFVIFLIVGFIMKSVSYPLGFLLGYLFNLAIFYVIIITSDMILNLKRSTSLIILLNIVKLAIYAIGFCIGGAIHLSVFCAVKGQYWTFNIGQLLAGV